MRQNRVSGFVRNDLPAEISMSNVGRNHMFQTLCQQSSATLTARKGGKQPDGAAARQPQQHRRSGRSSRLQRARRRIIPEGGIQTFAAGARRRRLMRQSGRSF